MKHYDAIVIGGGILGCFLARNLRRWDISVLLLEKEADVCTGITRANSAIVYAGYDNKPGSLKSELTVRGNANMQELCRELDVPFSRCGSLLVTWDEPSAVRMEKKLRNGIQNGVPGLAMLTGQQARELEPMLREGVTAALYAPTTGTVNPWQLGIAAFENARHNGTECVLGQAVRAIRQCNAGYQVETGSESYTGKMVFNCAGLSADKVHALVFRPTVTVRLDAAEYLVLDDLAEKPSRVIFHQALRCGKGITAIPCVEGNLLLSGVRKEMDEPFATTPEGLRELHQAARELLPQVQLDQVIRSFAAVRPNPQAEDGGSIPDFSICNPEPGFFSLIGVKTPGLTCANELGLYLAKKAAQYLNASENPFFNPVRKAIPADDGEIICQCQQITRTQILEAIARGAVSVEGVKRRLGTGMGRCQGSRCHWQIAQLLEEHRHGTN